VTQFGTNKGEPGVDVWTGTEDDGTEFPVKVLGDVEPRRGDSGMTNSNWVSSGESSNNVMNVFYAVSEELIVVPEPGATGCGLAALATLVVLARRRLVA
jgi:hypothetical protein